MRLLLVEDDMGLCDAIAYWLRAHKYEVDCCQDGIEAEFYIKEGTFDCILMDRMLPGQDGIAVLDKMRKDGNRTPVILITALGSLTDKLTGLNIGADDYLVKPFEFEELEARIRSVARRRYDMDTEQTLHFSDLSYRTENFCLTGPGGAVSLSKKEGRVMETLLANAGKTLSRETVLNRVWGLDSDVETANLDNYIHFLRRRLKSIKSRTKITNVWGVGFLLED